MQEPSMAYYDYQSTHSGAIIGSNDDLLTEILRRLPVTSILRFKSVSKHWLSLLSHRYFSLLYRNGSVSLGLFVHDLYVPYDDVENPYAPFCCLDFNLDDCHIEIMQSCNGLLLCCRDQGRERVRDYYVFNPTTKQCAIIPPIVEGVHFMGLAFHETDCVHYKVISIVKERQCEEFFQVQVYSSKTCKWKKASNVSFLVPYNTPFSGGVYWNGAFHWAPSCFTPLYFRLDVEQLQRMPLPSPLPTRVEPFGGYNDRVRPLYFGESQGHLHLVDIDNHENHVQLNVYEMLSDHSGWFVKYQVGLDDLQANIHINEESTRSYYYKFGILDVVRGEDEEEDTFMVIKVSKKIIRYSVSDKSFKQIFDLTNTIHESIEPWDVHRYTRTITSF